MRDLDSRVEELRRLEGLRRRLRRTREQQLATARRELEEGERALAEFEALVRADGERAALLERHLYKRLVGRTLDAGSFDALDLHLDRLARILAHGRERRDAQALAVEAAREQVEAAAAAYAHAVRKAEGASIVSRRFQAAARRRAAVREEGRTEERTLWQGRTTPFGAAG